VPRGQEQVLDKDLVGACRAATLFLMDKRTKLGLLLKGLGALGSTLAMGLGAYADQRAQQGGAAPSPSGAGGVKPKGGCPHCGGAHDASHHHHPGDGHDHGHAGHKH